ncbi:hypothetical protein EJ07DRAFT_160562, partial [Lizonia empirigonia]
MAVNFGLFSKRLTAICISLPGSNIFFYQDPASLTSIWKATTLSSPIYIYSVALRHMFGMPQAALSVYAADDSGPYRKPHPESNVAPHNRVDHLTHEILSRAFTGSALNLRCDGDGDPYWGSELARRRQKVLLDFDDQCDDAVAATDLGLMWTSIVNVVPASLMANIHIFRSTSLLSRLRLSLADKTHISPTNALSNIESLQKLPLLNSVYAETLRHYSQAYVTRCSPHNDVSLGEWTLPRNQVAMVSTYTAHHSEEYWNTKDGQHSVTDFWAERFLIDPKDPMSGPLRTDIDIPFRKAPKDLKPDDEPVFSTQGLDGIWIPYGGGYGLVL